MQQSIMLVYSPADPGIKFGGPIMANAECEPIRGSGAKPPVVGLGGKAPLKLTTFLHYWTIFVM